MSLNINPSYDATSEAANQLYNTQIPSLSQNANIQQALRQYHYGVDGVTFPLPQTNASINPQSIAGHFRSLKTEISQLQERGIGSAYLSSRPSSPENGFIWVDTQSAASINESSSPTIAFYQAQEPTGAVQGMFWVNSGTLSLNVYSGTIWQEVSGSGSSLQQLPTTSILNLFGTTNNVSAQAGSAFSYLDQGTTPTAFSVNTLVTSYTKTEVSVNIGLQSSSTAVGPIALVRVINGDLANPVTVGTFNHVSGSPLTFTIIDSHSQPTGSLLSYGLLNATAAGTPGEITFFASHSLQIYSREVS